MGFWDDNQQNYDQMNQAVDQNNHASLGHEVVSGGAAFGAMKLFEDKQRKDGQPVSHAFAKEMIAGFAGAEVDRFAEGTGENWVDKERSKHEAKKQAEQMYDDHYGQNDQYDPNSQQPPQQMQQYGNGNW